MAMTDFAPNVPEFRAAWTGCAASMMSSAVRKKTLRFSRMMLHMGGLRFRCDRVAAAKP